MIKRIFASEEDRSHISRLSIDSVSPTDDDFDYSKVAIQKPWGFEYLILNNNDVAVWILNIKSGGSTSMHCHPNKKTSLILLSGEARFSTLDQTSILPVGHGILMDKGVFHKTAALSPDGIMVMETETPAKKKDLIRYGDEYGRTGKGYEGENCHIELAAALPHFHRSHARYYEGKQFGQCRLMIVKNDIQQQLYILQNTFNADAVVMLGGVLYDKQNKVINTVGDMFRLDDANYTEAYAAAGTELLFIKKVS